MPTRLACAAVLLAAALSSFPATAGAQDQRDEDRAEDESPEDERGTAFEPVRGGARETVAGGRLLVIAYAFVWLVVFGYVFVQRRRQTQIEAELARLEKMLGDRKGPGA